VTTATDHSFLEGLSDERVDAATTTDQNVLLLAGPGAGKTHLLTAHAAFLAKRDMGRVVLLTFSRNAAAEMQARAARHLGAAAGVQRVVTRTIHAHAFELLKVHGRKLGIPGSISVPSKRLQERCLKRAAERLSVDPPDRFIPWLDRHRRLGASAPVPSPAYQQFAAEFERALVENGALDYGGAVQRATEMLRGDKAVRESVQRHDAHVLLDEAQDCDPSQIEFLDALIGEGSHLCVAMDPDQSLYGWRQADPARIEAWARPKCGKALALTENFRCAPRIHALGRFVLTGAAPPSVGVEGVVEQHAFSTREAEADYLAGELQSVRRLDRVAVLARVGWRLEEGRAALQRASVPVWAQLDEWSPADIKVLRALSLVDAAAVPRAPSAKLPYQDDFSDSIVAALCALASQKREPLQLVNSVAAVAGVSTEGLDHLLRMAGQARSLHDCLVTATQGPGESQKGGNLLTVTTFHGAKGCEFDVVYLVGVEERLVPDYRAVGSEAKMLEERRALYVAITRAAQRVVVTSAGARPSMFLNGAASVGLL
jgi:DNA helicase-2/ATP-dependent DNA helicase PcrA